MRSRRWRVAHPAPIRYVLRMPDSPSRLRLILDNPPPFLRRIVMGFRANQGFLLAAAVIVLVGAQVIAEYERVGTDQERKHGLQTG